MQIIPQCFNCRHLSDGAPPHCAAFPDEIPMAILLNEHDHKTPFAGDHGVRFEEGEPEWMKEVADA
jgi:hypothetical protein